MSSRNTAASKRKRNLSSTTTPIIDDAMRKKIKADVARLSKISQGQDACTSQMIIMIHTLAKMNKKLEIVDSTRIACAQAISDTTKTAHEKIKQLLSGVSIACEAEMQRFRTELNEEMISKEDLDRLYICPICTFTFPTTIDLRPLEMRVLPRSTADIFYNSMFSYCKNGHPMCYKCLFVTLRRGIGDAADKDKIYSTCHECRSRTAKSLDYLLVEIDDDTCNSDMHDFTLRLQ